jgi:uncharacterized protein (TIGR02246 family)
MSRSRISVYLLAPAVFAFAFAASCSRQPAAPPDTRATDEATIRAASADWSKASQAKDVDKAVAVYSDNAMQFPDNGPMVKGKDNIRAGWQKMLALPGPGLTFATTGVEVARSGDLAYEYGTYDFATQDKNGKVNDEKGKYVAVWKKQADNSWKVVADIDNPDAAAAPAPAPKPATTKRKSSTTHKRRHRRSTSS